MARKCWLTSTSQRRRRRPFVVVDLVDDDDDPDDIDWELGGDLANIRVSVGGDHGATT